MPVFVAVNGWTSHTLTITPRFSGVIHIGDYREVMIQYVLSDSIWVSYILNWVTKPDPGLFSVSIRISCTPISRETASATGGKPPHPASSFASWWL